MVPDGKMDRNDDKGMGSREAVDHAEEWSTLYPVRSIQRKR